MPVSVQCILPVTLLSRSDSLVHIDNSVKQLSSCWLQAAVQDDDDRKLIRMHDVIQQLPPPHHR